MHQNLIEKQFYDSLSLLSSPTGVVLGVSGGPDSMAMLHLFIKARDEGKISFPFACATLNHGLRPEAERETEGVGEFCKKHNVPFFTEKVDVTATLPKGESTENHARNCRYGFFERVKAACGFSHTATAHNADDNLESIMLNLLRGCGTDGVCGISPLRKDNNTLRPLLRLTKEELTRYCESNSVPYYIDASNLDSVYRRNFIRNRITPLMREINPSVEDAAYRLSRAATEDCEFLETLARDAYGDALTEKGLSLDRIRRLHPALLTRVLRSYVRDVTEKVPAFSETEELKRLVTEGTTSSGARVCGVDFILTYTHLTRQTEESEAAGFQPFTPSLGEYSLPHGIIIFTEGREYSGQKNCISLTGLSSTVIRTREEGDYMHTPQGSGKLLKKLYIDKKIPRSERPFLPILTLEGRIVWAAGIGAAKEFIPLRGAPYIKVKYISK